MDVIFGTAATAAACLLTQHMPHKWLAPLPPVLCNAIIVGGGIAWTGVGFGPGFWQAYAINAATVGVGELIACYVLGLLLLAVLPKITALHPFMQEKRLRAV